MPKAALHQLIQRSFADVPERRMPQIMSQCNGFS